MQRLTPRPVHIHDAATLADFLGLGLTPGDVEGWAEEGFIPGFRIDGMWRFNLCDVLDALGRVEEATEVATCL